MDSAFTDFAWSMSDRGKSTGPTVQAPRASKSATVGKRKRPKEGWLMAVGMGRGPGLSPDLHPGRARLQWAGARSGGSPPQGAPQGLGFGVS